MRKIRTLTVLAVTIGTAGALAAGASGSAASAARPAHFGHHAAGALVSVGSPSAPFLQNLQAQPALAVDPVAPDLIAAAGNDLVDLQPCSKEASAVGAACSTPATPGNGGRFPLGVGTSGVYFSHDRGHHWTQPTYQGLTAVGCSPTAEPCQPKPGPIHTVPNYYETGLQTVGDASVAFGPVLRNGKFSWANGSRLYFSSQTKSLTHTAIKPGTIDATTTTTVSHIDDPTPARVADQSNWSDPVIVPTTQPAVSDPTDAQIWADNASSSPHFGNVYACYNDFYFQSGIPIYPTVAASSDGGQTWTTSHIAPPVDSASDGYRLACTVRTDSHGRVYAFFTHYPGAFPSNGLPGAVTIVESSDGGATWSQPVDFMPINTACYYFDTVQDRCAMDGPGGSSMENGPSVGIANGAPTGADATNEITLAWTDGRFGQNHEASLLSYSTDGAKTWSAPAAVSLPGDRPMYSAVAIAPDGSRVYATYNAYTTPFSAGTSTPRPMHGVLRSAAIRPDGAPAAWATDYVGASGDVRGTAFGDYNYDEFLGFSVSAVATDTYGDGAWTDVRRAADCPAMDAWREASLKAGTVTAPAPWPLADCPANFGNSDIWSATTAR